MNILRIDSSARYEASRSRDRADIIVEHLIAQNPGASVVTRDVAAGLPYVDEAWVAAKTVAPDARTQAQIEALAPSFELIEELEAADTYVIRDRKSVV